MWSTHDTGWASPAAAAALQPAPATRDPAFMLRVLDEMDYGLVVVNAQLGILHCNHLARQELGCARMLVSHGQFLMGSTLEIASQLEAAVGLACRGQRRLEVFHRGDKALAASFIPLSHPLEPTAPQVLVTLERQSVCDNLAVRMFARGQGLSPGEELVLIALCRGLSIRSIAQEHGVAESTVRTQVKSVRAKTGSISIRDLLARINRLPPVVPALRIIAPVQHNSRESSSP